MKQYIVVGGDEMRLFDDGKVPQQLSTLSPPCDFMFTNVKLIGWMTVSIEAARKTTVYTPLGPGARSI
jgi:hypothetical protein